MTVQSNVNNQQLPVFEPIQIFDGLTGTTRYVGTTLTFTDTAAPLWRIQKIWEDSGIWYSGFPDGIQDFVYVWNSRAGYTYK